MPLSLMDAMIGTVSLFQMCGPIIYLPTQLSIKGIFGTVNNYFIEEINSYY